MCEILSFYHQLSYQFFCDQKEECICYFTKTETINGELNFPLSITYYTERINFTLLRSYYKMSAYLIYLLCLSNERTFLPTSLWSSHHMLGQLQGLWDTEMNETSLLPGGIKGAKSRYISYLIEDT